ncbi:hypothetical protein, partial [Streptomyces kasugaensis]|uniref:hypothetical protein n=1 Tax=Streptomyces kasugaensis TaxID=1946 RepID=UPI001A952DAF
WHCVMRVSLPAADIPENVWLLALRSAPPVPHSDTDVRFPPASATLIDIMRFGLLLLSCRGEGL